jgi:hypothetical protein
METAGNGSSLQGNKFPIFLEYQMMDEVQKPCNSD